MVDKEKNPEPTKHYSNQELEVLKKLNHRLALLSENKYQFRSGIYRGIGFAIGASIIGAIVVSLLLSLLEGIDNPFINDVVEQAQSIQSEGNTSP